MEEIRAAAKNRYWSDPEVRRKAIEYARKAQAENPERIRAINGKCRNTPQRRQRAVEVSQKWHDENRDYANVRRGSRNQSQRITQPWTILVGSAKTRSKKYRMPFDLTHEWAKRRWTGNCELTGLPFFVGKRGGVGHVFSPSIDRIKPELGYVQSNCRIVLLCVNIFKYNGTDAQMYEVAAALLRKKNMAHQGILP